MKAWRLKIDMMGGSAYHDVIFKDGTVAKMVAKDKTAEFQNFIPEEVDIEPLGQRCICEKTVFDYDIRSADDEYRRRGLAKLSEEEKAALGLTPERLRELSGVA
jgi:hypothetical protein